MAKNELAKVNPNDLVARLEKSYVSALPNSITKEAFGRALLTSLRKTPELTKCAPASLASAVTTAAQLGLPIGLNGAAYLVPFKEECTLIIGYQGLIELIYRSDSVDSVSADVVCENDTFEFEQGTNQKLRHVPCLKGPRGAPYAVYAIARIKGSDTPVYVVMGREEVLKVKAASRAASGKSSPWNGQFETEMWKKTAVRRLAKMLPKSADRLQAAFQYESDEDEKWAAARTVEADDPFQPGRTHVAPRKAEPQAEQVVELEPEPEAAAEPSPAANANSTQAQVIQTGTSAKGKSLYDVR